MINSNFRQIARLCLFCLSISLLTGCGRDASIAQVDGIVELDGAPLAKFDNAAVVFTPRAGRLATSVIDRNGRFQLQTNGIGEGAAIGEAKITVSATIERPKSSVSDERYDPVVWVIPRRFGDADRSGLSCKVVAGKLNSFKISLSSDGTGSVEILQKE
ncbi:hypothetical protein M4951_13340 [Blastopirellula sp. J2-11]|uniref:hypothetical protein n=1 Tax=Blastopirellula sp. J2-11 TaxID=2943192 RepID=UPI0021CA2B40|nr:hypothetical protein [Blastopirellula sp. J2-11]UUO04378.1 hypothetical protein M4951_13340 [Blastopirellula sp. J2-11]